MRSHTRRAVRSLCVLSCLGLISYGLVGCGGSDSPTPSSSPSPSGSPRPTPTPTPAPARARVEIVWGARTRIEGLSSAISAEIKFSGAKQGGGDLVFKAERPKSGDAAAEYSGAPTATYTSDENAITGRPFPLTVTFYSEPNQGGSIVGTAQANATVKADGSIDSTIATYGRIRSVVVDRNQSFPMGQAGTLRYSGLDADGTTQIMVRPGTARISIVSGADKISLNGDLVTGIKPREASVVVNIDQATSVATSVYILSDVKVTPNVSDLTLSIEKAFNFSATVTGTGVSDTGVVWGVRDAPLGVTITPAGRLTVGRNEGDFFVTATSVFDPDPLKVAEVRVRILSAVRVEILDKPAAIVGIGDKIKLNARVTDGTDSLTDTTVTWQVVDKATGAPASGLGTVDANGEYSAPNTPGSYRVVATSRFDTRKSDFVDVDVRAGSVGVDVK
ncbi:MAG: hypothetical protein H8F28_15610 [Fibrella sp.]|nr:hypothetical protein [Armatimonadota bacterium]